MKCLFRALAVAVLAIGLVGFLLAQAQPITIRTPGLAKPLVLGSGVQIESAWISAWQGGSTTQTINLPIMGPAGAPAASINLPNSVGCSYRLAVKAKVPSLLPKQQPPLGGYLAVYDPINKEALIITGVPTWRSSEYDSASDTWTVTYYFDFAVRNGYIEASWITVFRDGRPTFPILWGNSFGLFVVLGDAVAPSAAGGWTWWMVTGASSCEP
jgi:hypothetical protein